MAFLKKGRQGEGEGLPPQGFGLWRRHYSLPRVYVLAVTNTVEPRFNEVAGDRQNLFVKWRVRYIENLDITNLRGKDQNVRYVEVIVKD